MQQNLQWFGSELRRVSEYSLRRIQCPCRVVGPAVTAFFCRLEIHSDFLLLWSFIVSNFLIESEASLIMQIMDLILCSEPVKAIIEEEKFTTLLDLPPEVGLLGSRRCASSVHI